MSGWFAAAALLGVAVTGCAAGPPLSSATEPLPAVRLVLGFAGAPARPGREVELGVTVHAVAEVGRVRIDLRLPAEMALVSGSTSWTESLHSGEQRERRVSVILQPGEYNVGVAATVLDPPYAGQVAGAVLYLKVTPASATWGSQPP